MNGTVADQPEVDAGEPGLLLFLRGERARREGPDLLEAAGWRVEELVVYEARPRSGFAPDVAIVTDDRLVEQGEKQWRVAARPDRITPESAKMFGYDPELWAVAPGVRQVLTEVAEMLPKDRIVVPAGQNVRMDVLFLERAYKKCEIPYPFDYHVIDLATLFYSWTLVTGEPAAALSLRQAATQAGLN